MRSSFTQIPMSSKCRTVGNEGDGTRKPSPSLDQSSPKDVGHNERPHIKRDLSSVGIPVQPIINDPPYGRMSLEFLTQTQGIALDSHILSNPLPSSYGPADTQEQPQSSFQSQTELEYARSSQPLVHRPVSALPANVWRRDVSSSGRDTFPGDNLGSSSRDQDLEQLEAEDSKGKGLPMKRRRVETACNACRKRKSKCGGSLPCHSCLTNHTECIYPPPAKKLTIKHFEELEQKISELQSLNDAYEHRSLTSTARAMPSEVVCLDESQRQEQQPASTSHESCQPGLSTSILGVSSDARSIQQPNEVHLQPLSQQTSPFGSGSSMRLFSENCQSQPASNKGSLLGQSSQGLFKNPETSSADVMTRDQDRVSSIRERVTATNDKRRKGKSAQFGISVSGSKTLEINTSESNERTDTVRTDEVIKIQQVKKGLEAAKSDGDDMPTDANELIPQWNSSRRITEDAAMKSHRVDRGQPTNTVPDTFVMHAILPPASRNDLFCLPSLAEAEGLLGYYHERTHYLLPVFDFVDLYDRYLKAACWPESKPRTAIDLVFHASLNLIFSIVAISRCSEEDVEQLPTYFRISQSIMSATHVLIMMNVEMIQHLLLLCYYSQSCSKGRLAVNAVGLAIFMSRNIQLDKPEVNSKTNFRERCIRQRVWAACIQMEAMTSEMLYRQTTLKECDFAADTMTLIDDDDFYPSSQRSIKQPDKILFFRESTKLFDIKTKILHGINVIKDIGMLPNILALVDLEVELHEWWNQIPEDLKETSPNIAHGAINTWLQMQSHNLIFRYYDALVLIHRPFLFFFCSALQSDVPSQKNIRYDIARKSAALCAEAAISLINKISQSLNDIHIGFWWCLLGYVYNSSLVILAHRIVNQTYPASISNNAEQKSTEAICQGLDFLQEVGMHGGDSLRSRSFSSMPPRPARSTARRCFIILTNIHQAVQTPPREEESIMAVFRASEQSLNETIFSNDNEFMSSRLESMDSNLMSNFKTFESSCNPESRSQLPWKDWASLAETGLLSPTNVEDDTSETVDL